MALCMTSALIHAQNEITLKAGTNVSLQAINATRATQVEKGQSIAFRVSRDVMVNGVTAIPYGTIVNGTVYEAKRSSWWGTKGRLGININEIVMQDGTTIPLQNGNIYITGENRTVLSVVTALFFLPCCCICGSGAVLPLGYEVQTNVATNTTLTVQ